MHVTFTGNGTFVLHNDKGLSDATEDHLQWTVEYQSTIDANGLLTTAEAIPAPTTGTYTFSNAFFNVNCAGTISTAPGPILPGDPEPPPAATPLPKVEGSLVQSITYLSDYGHNGNFSQCTGEKGYEGEDEAAGQVGGVLNHFLPGATTVQLAPVPRALLLAPGAALRVETVSSAQAPEQVPGSCSYLFGIDDPNLCTMSLQWSGIVILDATAACPLILAGPPLACVPPAGTSASAFTSGVEASATGPGSIGLSASTTAAASSRAALARRTIIAMAKTKVTHAGQVRLRPRLTAAGRRLLARTRRLTVSVQIVFTPRSGPPHTTRFATVLRGR